MAGADSMVFRMDSSLRMLGEIKVDGARVVAMCPFKDGFAYAMEPSSGLVHKIWYQASEDEARILLSTEDIIPTTMAYDESSQAFVIGGTQGQVQYYTVINEEGNLRLNCVISRHLHNHWVLGISFDSTNAQLVSCSADGSAVVWDTTSAITKRKVTHPHQKSCSAAVFCAGALVTSHNNGDLYVWDLAPESADRRHIHAHKECIYTMIVVGNVLLTSSRDHTVRAFDSSSWHCIAAKKFDNEVTQLTSDGYMLYAGVQDTGVVGMDSALSVRAAVSGHVGPMCVISEPLKLKFVD